MSPSCWCDKQRKTHPFRYGLRSSKQNKSAALLSYCWASSKAVWVLSLSRDRAKVCFAPSGMLKRYDIWGGLGIDLMKKRLCLLPTAARTGQKQEWREKRFGQVSGGVSQKGAGLNSASLGKGGPVSHPQLCKEMKAIVLGQRNAQGHQALCRQRHLQFKQQSLWAGQFSLCLLRPVVFIPPKTRTAWFVLAIVTQRVEDCRFCRRAFLILSFNVYPKKIRPCGLIR